MSDMSKIKEKIEISTKIHGSFIKIGKLQYGMFDGDSCEPEEIAKELEEYSKEEVLNLHIQALKELDGIEESRIKAYKNSFENTKKEAIIYDYLISTIDYGNYGNED